ncbi:hypothetical protein CUR178_05398 [Leishmania enriettii]|uniref:DUF7920 domain-containing protein n=1 Tax=Leishmania enriettii TaxID=5663 RepID=A0A836KK94_LEIEN|nr:hypothetical protein CUR178_05398 [Leishmania enriettii]
MPSSRNAPFRVGTVLAASNGSAGSSPVAGSFSDFVAAEIYGDLQPPLALSLSARSSADSRICPKSNSVAAVMPTAAAASSSHRSDTAAYVISSIAVTGASDEHNFSKPAVVALDEEQRRCVNSAYRISFRGDPRVKLKPTAVELPNGAQFFIVDRFVSGNCDGVYERNKKMWEHIPVGQACVFARAPPAAHSPSLSELVESARVDCERSSADIAAAVPLPCPKRLGSPIKTALGSPPLLLPIAPSSTASVLGSISQSTEWASSQLQQCSFHNEWTRVAAAVGLRKMGHWREATSVFSIHKEISETAIALEKVDGESGRIAAFSWLGERYWIIGCRYQHIVTRLDVPEVDLVRYATSSGSLASTPSSPSTVSDDAPVSARLPSAGRPSASSRDDSPSQNTLDGAEHSSVHGGAAGKCIGGASSEAAYLELTIRMARLWRNVLESLRTSTDGAAEALGTASSSEAAAAAARADALLELHACVAADNRSLCFDVILSGWERLQNFSGVRDFPVDKSLPHISIPGTGPSNSTTCTNRANSTPFMVESAPVTSDSNAASSTITTMPAAIPLWFYAVTWDASLDERGWCMGVEEAFAFFRRFGLPTVPKSADVPTGSPEYEGLRQSVLSRCNTAGAVMYGSSKDKTEGGSGALVVQVWKCRAYPHSLERTVQEYVVTHRLCGEPLRCKVKKKVSSLSREIRLCIKQWELHRLPFLLEFALWLHREKYITPLTDLVALKAIRGQWLSYQERFQKILEAQQEQRHRAFSRQGTAVPASETMHSRRETRADAVDGVCCSASNADKHGEGEHGESYLQQQSWQDDASLHDAESLDPILLVGPQGCGKSTMARILFALLEESGAAPRWLNQDEVGNRSAYLAAVRRAVTQGSCSHLLLDKMNLDEKSRSDYAAAGLKPALVVAWTHNEGVEAMVEVCYERVVKRGVHHRTFCPEDVASLQPPPSFVPSRAPELRPAVLPPLQGRLSQSASRDTSPTPSSTASLSPVSAGQCGCSPNAPFPPTRSPPPPTRLHGILHANAKRYQVPTNAPLVELDVTWSCQKMAAVVWEALRDKGTCLLPPLAELHVEDAIHTSYAYEQLLETYPSRVASAVLRGPSSEVVLQQLSLVLPPITIPKAQRLQPTIEVLLHNFFQHPSPTALVRYAGQVGHTRRMTVQAVVSNSKVTLLLMLGQAEAAASHSASFAAADEHGEESVLPEHACAVPPALPPDLSVENTGSKAAAIGQGGSGVSVASSAEDPSSTGGHPMQEYFAVLAKAKVTPEYSEALARRVRDDPEEDPYCTVRWLSPPLEIDFAVTLLLP